MASEIYRERIFGNFRQTPSALRKSKKPSRQMRREGNDPKHLAFVRKLFCVLCGARVNVQAHHLKLGTGERGIGMKSTDRWAIPLCSAPGRRLDRCHAMIEDVASVYEEQVCIQHGLPDPKHLALDIFANTGNLKYCARTILRHRSKWFPPDVMRDLREHYDLGSAGS